MSALAVQYLMIITAVLLAGAVVLVSLALEEPLS